MRFLLITFLSFVITLTTKAQQTSVQTIVIKTSAVCETCKASIERAVAFEKGIKAVNLNVETRELTVTFKTDKVTADKIRKAVAMTGYDADDVKADPKAYAKIDACCKKENEVH